MEFLRSYKRLQSLNRKEEKAKKEVKSGMACSKKRKAKGKPMTDDEILFQQLEKVINAKVVEHIPRPVPSPKPKEVLPANEGSDDNDDDDEKETEQATSSVEGKESPKNKALSVDESDDENTRKRARSLDSVDIEAERTTSETHGDFEVIDDASSDSILTFPPHIPDRSKSDYYCEVCDCHMNNMQMWESHISGKRHVKNIRKPPGELPSKVRTVKLQNVTPFLQSKINRIQEPVVGLSYVCEYQRAEKDVSPLYTCYLCHGTMGKTQTLEHVVSAKHRFNFLKEVDPEGANVIKSMGLKRETKESLICGKVADWEEKHGREKMEVRMEVKRSAPLPAINVRKKIKLRHNAEEKINYREKATTSPVPSYQRSPSPRPYRHCETENNLPSYERYEHGSPVYESEEKDLQTDHIISYIKNSSTRTKLRLLEELSHPPITSEHEARTTMHVINILNQLILQYKLRCLPRNLQGSLIRELLAQKSLSVLDQSSIQSSLASGILGGLGGGMDMSSMLGSSVAGISNINTVLSSLRDRFSVVGNNSLIGNQGISSSLIGSSLIGNTSVISSTVENHGLTPFLQETALLNDFERARVLRQSLTETPLLTTLSASNPFHL